MFETRNEPQDVPPVHHDEDLLCFVESVFDEPEFKSLALHADGCASPNYVKVSGHNSEKDSTTQFLVEVTGRDEEEVKEEIRSRVRQHREVISDSDLLLMSERGAAEFARVGVYSGDGPEPNVERAHKRAQKLPFDDLHRFRGLPLTEFDADELRRICQYITDCVMPANIDIAVMKNDEEWRKKLGRT